MRCYPGLRGLSILLVEDEPALRTLARIMLTNAGCRVIECCNGTEALQLGLGGCFDLILMDIKMPEIDGIEVIRRLRSNPRTQGTPIVILSALAAESDQEAGLAAGANAYVTKPYDFDDLLALLDGLHPQPQLLPQHEV